MLTLTFLMESYNTVMLIVSVRVEELWNRISAYIFYGSNDVHFLKGLRTSLARVVARTIPGLGARDYDFFSGGGRMKTKYVL